MAKQDLTQQTLSGLIWKFAERIGAQLVSTIVSIILARVLLPEDYGVVAVVTIIITLCNVFVTSGFGSALVQKKDADDVDFSSVLYMSLIISVVIYAVIFFCAPFIAKAYDNSLLTTVIRVMGIRIPIAAINSVQQAYVARKMQFKKFFVATIFGTVFSGALGIYMAYTGYGVWALVAQYLTNVTISTIVLGFVIKWKPLLVFSFERIGSLLSYGWKLLASGLIDTGYNELRGLIIGIKYSPLDLGVYEQGKRYPSLLAVNINESINSVLLSSMSKVQDDKEKVKQATRKSIRLSAYILMPCMIGLACVAENFVRVILTDKWIPVIPYLQIMCISYMFHPIHTANLTAIKAVGRSDIFLTLEIIKKVIGLVLLGVSMWYGVFWIAMSQILATLISSIVNSFPNKKLLNYSYFEQFKDLLSPLLLSLFMGLVVYFMGYIPMSRTLLLIVQVLTGIILYIVGSIVVKDPSFSYIWGFLKKLFKKNKGQPKKELELKEETKTSADTNTQIETENQSETDTKNDAKKETD